MLYYPISTKAVRHFCRTALLFRLYLNRLHTRNVLLQSQEIRFIEMPRHGNVQHDFTELPSCRLRSISRTVIFLCASQSYRRTRSPLPSVRPTTPLRCTKITPAPRKPIPAAMLAATRETSTETPAAPTIGKNHTRRPASSVLHRAKPSAAPDRSFEYFPAYASPFRIKTIAQTTDTASPERSVCRYHPLQAYHIPSRKHGTPSDPRFPPET